MAMCSKLTGGATKRCTLVAADLIGDENREEATARE